MAEQVGESPELLMRWGGNARSWLWRTVTRKLRARHIYPTHPRWLPLTVQIEPSSRCNLRCPTCSNSRESSSGKFLSVDELRNFLDRIPFVPQRIILSGIGEPLLNPHFFSLVDIIAERHITCEFITNGTLISPAVIKEILSRRTITNFYISCDGARKKTFEALRLGADFDKWLASTRTVLDEAKKVRGGSLTIGMITVISRENIEEIGDIISLAAEMGFNGINLHDSLSVDDFAAAASATQTELSTLSTKELIQRGKEAGIPVHRWWVQREATPPAARLRCLMPWEYVFIRVNGDIHPCSALFGREKMPVMGNIMRQDFMEIWHGEQFREFRRSNARGQNSLCRDCNYY